MSKTVNYIFDYFRITNDEYLELNKKLGNYCYHVAWDLKKNNSKNNVTDELEDIVQDLKWAMSTACIYNKRQTYIKSCLKEVRNYINDNTILLIVDCLEYLWNNRTSHGANRQRFGEWQEKVLDTLVEYFIPKEKQPNKNACLIIDSEFEKYCKSIIWNRSKNLGKKITRDRGIRSGMVSLSENPNFCGAEY